MRVDARTDGGAVAPFGSNAYGVAVDLVQLGEVNFIAQREVDRLDVDAQAVRDLRTLHEATLGV